jgi:hypothetical protein
MTLCLGAQPGLFLEEGAGAVGEVDVGERAPLRAGEATTNLEARHARRHGGGRQRCRGAPIRLAAVAGCIGLLALALLGTWPRAAALTGEPEPIVALVTVNASNGDAEVTAECRRYVRDTPCSWTQRYSCPGQEPKGSMGVVPRQGSEDYRCCCEEGLWRGLPEERTSTTTQALSEPRVDACGAGAPPEAWFPEATGMRIRTTSTTTTTPPPAAPPVCEVALEEYSTSDRIQAQCASLDHWQQEEQKAARQNNSYCHIDPRTKLMTCNRQEKCAGGQKVRHRFENATKTMTYHCDSGCKGTLYFGCCEACEAATSSPRSIGVDKIICNGCDEETKNQVKSEGEAHCELKGGTFECSTSEECRTGRPRQTCEVTDYTCNIYPCNSCQTHQLKAACCALCLETMCGRAPQERLFCEGCTHAPDSHPWWTLGLGR